MTTLLLAISAAGLLAWGAAVLAGWNATPRPGNRVYSAPSRWRGHP